MKKINVLIIGQGGREHALGWKIVQSPLLKKIYFAPGNGGTCQLGENISIKINEIEKLIDFALKNRIDLTVVGPEEPLALGIVDCFTKKNLLIFGPTKKAAQLETSKSFAVSFMKKYHIPHPPSWIFNNPKEAIRFIKKSPLSSFAIKADGLAAGKGVIIVDSKEKAKEAVETIMVRKKFGQAGKKIVIQKKVKGEEISVLTITDGKVILIFPPAQDHKRVFDGDQGPNTGGMGAYAPVPFVKKNLLKEIKEKIIEPTLTGMRKEGKVYQGILYAGLILTNTGPQVLEFNARFGDPETQPLMMLLEGDILPLLIASAKGNLAVLQSQFRVKMGSAVCVVLSAKGYPDEYQKGEIININNASTSKQLTIFHAGTIVKDNQLLTNGGRVVGVTGYGKNLKSALKKIYQFIEKKGVYFEGQHYRKDIGKKTFNFKYDYPN